MADLTDLTTRSALPAWSAPRTSWVPPSTKRTAPAPSPSTPPLPDTDREGALAALEGGAKNKGKGKERATVQERRPALAGRSMTLGDSVTLNDAEPTMGARSPSMHRSMTLPSPNTPSGSGSGGLSPKSARLRTAPPPLKLANTSQPERRLSFTMAPTPPKTPKTGKKHMWRRGPDGTPPASPIQSPSPGKMYNLPQSGSSTPNMPTDASPAGHWRGSVIFRNQDGEVKAPVPRYGYGAGGWGSGSNTPRGSGSGSTTPTSAAVTPTHTYPPAYGVRPRHRPTRSQSAPPVPPSTDLFLAEARDHRGYMVGGGAGIHLPNPAMSPSASSSTTSSRPMNGVVPYAVYARSVGESVYARRSRGASESEAADADPASTTTTTMKRSSTWGGAGGGGDVTLPVPGMHRPKPFWRHTRRSGVTASSYAPAQHVVRRSTFIAAGLPMDAPALDYSALGVEGRLLPYTPHHAHGKEGSGQAFWEF